MSSGSMTSEHLDSTEEFPLFDAHDKQYLLIALGLAILTAIEVVLSYIGLEKAALALPLLALAAIKFIIVAAFFMHLRQDNPVFRKMFIMGAVLAGFCYIGVLSAFGVLSGAAHWLIYGVFSLVILAVWVFNRKRADDPDHDHEHDGHDHGAHSHSH